MTISTVESEVADFWLGHGEYIGFSISPGSGEAVKRFLSRNIVIPRSELPEIYEEDGGLNANPAYHLRIRENRASGGWGVLDAGGHRLVAALELARAEYRERAEAESVALKEAEATAARDKRRDELAEAYLLTAYWNLKCEAQKFVDRFIELEGAAK